MNDDNPVTLQNGSDHPDDGNDQGAEGHSSEVEDGGVPQCGSKGTPGEVFILIQGPVPLQDITSIHDIVQSTDNTLPEKTPLPAPSLRRRRRKTLPC